MSRDVAELHQIVLVISIDNPVEFRHATAHIDYHTQVNLHDVLKYEENYRVGLLFGLGHILLTIGYQLIVPEASLLGIVDIKVIVFIGLQALKWQNET